MKIAVAGGTGFVGRHVSRALIDAGHQVTVLTRSPTKAGSIPQLAEAGARGADVTDPRSLRGVLDGIEAVVGAVQFPNYPMESPRKGLTFDRYDRQGTENLLAEATRAEVGRYVYISGVGADPHSDNTGYRAKGRAEEAVKESGLSWSILRPSWAYGPEDRALNTFATIARLSPVVPIPGTGPQLLQPVYIGDVALTVRRIFERAEAWGRVFEIGSEEVMTMVDVVRTLLEVMGKKRVVVGVPKPLVKLATGPLVVLPRPLLTPRGVDFAVQDAVADIRELEEVLDVRPLSLKEGLSRYLRP